jgi:hypothetical protein
MSAPLSGPEQLVLDVVGLDASYPAGPGRARGSETSAAAANEIFDFARGILGKVALHLVEIYPGGATPDEVADALGISLLTARPRFSQLGAAGLIEKVGERRPTRGLVTGAVRHQFKAEAWRASPLLLSARSSPSIVPGGSR